METEYGRISHGSLYLHCSHVTYTAAPEGAPLQQIKTLLEAEGPRFDSACVCVCACVRACVCVRAGTRLRACERILVFLSTFPFGFVIDVDFVFQDPVRQIAKLDQFLGYNRSHELYEQCVQ